MTSLVIVIQDTACNTRNQREVRIVLDSSSPMTSINHREYATLLGYAPPY